MKQHLFFVFASFLFYTCTNQPTAEIGTAVSSHKFTTEVFYDRGGTIPNSASRERYDSLWRDASAQATEAVSSGDSITAIRLFVDLSRSFEYGNELATFWSDDMNRQLGEKTIIPIIRDYMDMCASIGIEVDTSRMKVSADFSIRPSPKTDGDTLAYEKLIFCQKYHLRHGVFPQDLLSLYRRASIQIVINAESKPSPVSVESTISNPIRTHDGGRGDWLLWVIGLLFILEIALLIWSFGVRTTSKAFILSTATAITILGGIYLLSLVDWSTVGGAVARLIRIGFMAGSAAIIIRLIQMFGEWFSQFWPAISDWFARGLVRHPVTLRVNRYELLGTVVVVVALIGNALTDLWNWIF